jgi:hypothetical protein
LVEQPVNTRAAGASTATSNAVLSEVVEVIIREKCGWVSWELGA